LWYLSQQGNTALINIVGKGMTKVVPSLLQKIPTIINARNHVSRVVWNMTFHFQAVVDFLEHINYWKFKQDGKTALMQAVLLEHIDIAHILLNHHADANISGSVRQQCFKSNYLSICFISYDLLCLKLQNGATVLMAAVMSGQLSLIRQLVKIVDDVNVYCDDGFSAIHIAILCCQSQALQILLDCGASLEVCFNCCCCRTIDLIIVYSDK
jgi:hypothetical protein